MLLKFPCESCDHEFSYKELLSHRCNVSSSTLDKSKRHLQLKSTYKGKNTKKQRTLTDIFSSKKKFDQLSDCNKEIIDLDEDDNSVSVPANNSSNILKKERISQGEIVDTKKLSTSPKDKFKTLGLVRWNGKSNNFHEKKDNLSLANNSKAQNLRSYKNSEFLGNQSVNGENESKDLGHNISVNGNFIPSDKSKYYDGLDYLLKEKEVEIKKLKFEKKIPLSEIIAPKILSDYLGNSKLVGKNGVITKFIYLGKIPSMIFWGETGIGKTTLVKLILTEILKIQSSKKNFLIYHLNASSTNLKEIKEIYEKFKLMKKLKEELKMILFLDETHRFTKLQQDFFLKLIENEELIFFGCTTENPSFKLNNALLSRCHVFHLDSPLITEMESVINRGVLYINKSRILLEKLRPIIFTKDARTYLAQVSSSDYRTALMLLELLSTRYTEYLTADEAFDILQYRKEYETEKKIVIHLDILKDFLKKNSLKLDSVVELRDVYNAMKVSILKQNKDSAFVYLAYILQNAVDPLDVCNFLRDMIMESYDTAVNKNGVSLLSFLNNVYFAVSKLGMPECDLSMVQLVYLMCNSEISRNTNKAVHNIETFLKDNPNSISLKIPMHIRNAPTDLMKEFGYHKGYKYNPDFDDGKISQYYLPRGIRKKKFFEEFNLK